VNEGKRYFQDLDITSVVLADTITVLGDCFHHTNITSIVFPETFQKISSSNTFERCYYLSSITCYSTTAPELASNLSFQYIPFGGTLYYPAGSDYSTWLSTEQKYLGYYEWTGQEI
jgi:hypothetical protein